MHGGTVTATSEGPGERSEFSVRLPLSQMRGVAATPPAAPTIRSGLRVLAAKFLTGFQGYLHADAYGFAPKVSRSCDLHLKSEGCT
jgi:hypothetical protein